LRCSELPLLAGSGRFLPHAPQHHGVLLQGSLNGGNRPKAVIQYLFSNSAPDPLPIY
jgi:hypothetical protein